MTASTLQRQHRTPSPKRPTRDGLVLAAVVTCQQLGAALGVAILVSIFARVAANAEAGNPEAFAADAFVAATAFAVLILVLVVGAARSPSVREG